MVKFYDSSYTYDYSFPAVTLAYFLRYPNPYSTHVVSTDVIDRHFDPETQTLHTTRLHLKKSKLPSAALKIIPRSLLGTSPAGDSQSFILERSVVNIKDGWMNTESQNLEWTGVLSVIERQVFTRPANAMKSLHGHRTAAMKGFLLPGEKTDVKTTVTLHSMIGENIQEEPSKPGFFKSWSTASIQRSIEIIGLRRAEKSQPNAKEGMKIVLQRLRQGGLVAVMEGMRKDREGVVVGHAAVKATSNGGED
ncbi:PRELI-like family-domain-containing protein [Phyllosticta capitalensis]|uniref:PRELI-like family-domain-containing protein n=1 Tax=Phyllosticta capitalensis TaxID=121624 RepID=UPI00312F4B53